MSSNRPHPERLGDLADEIGLAHRRLLEGHVGRRVFEQDRAFEPVLDLADMGDDALKCLGS
jgi:hypothetical protein